MYGGPQATLGRGGSGSSSSYGGPGRSSGAYESAGRGRNMAIPAWMQQQQAQQAQQQAAAAPAPVPGLSASDRDRDRDRSDRDRSDRDRDRSDRDRSDRDRDRSARDRSDRDRSDRDRDRSDRDRDRSDRSDRDRDRSDRDRSDRDRSDRERSSRHHRKSASPSRSRSPARRRPRKSNFDVTPDQLTPQDMQPSWVKFVLSDESRPALIAAPPPGITDASVAAPIATSIARSMANATGGGAATRHARRLYVGGVEREISAQDLTVFFNDVVSRALVDPMDGPPVVDVYVSHERRFAFVEFRSIELASACMALDGIVFRGIPFRIKRPNDYNPTSLPPSYNPIPRLDLSLLGEGATSVPDNPNKIFIGGLPTSATQDQVKELLEAFGTLKALHLVKEPRSDVSKGFGFCEYADPSVTDAAIAALNGMAVGDKVLAVRRAAPDGAEMGMMGGDFTGMPVTLDLSTSVAALPASDAWAPKNAPTPVLVLKNMVQPADLVDTEEYEDLVSDIETEARKYGTLISTVVPREGPGALKVFLEYAEIEQAKTAANALAGRQFGDNFVSVEYMDPRDFAARNFS